jgi:hypothetical protein
MQLPKISAPLVLSGLALAVSLGGVGAAATGLINGASIKPGTITGRQIRNHSVPVIKLSGKLPKGPRGATGPAGPFPKQLPTGVTVQGAWEAGGNATAINNYFYTSISWFWPTKSPVNVSVVPMGSPSTAHCPGTYLAPTAAPGYLCIYSSGALGTAPRPLGQWVIDPAGVIVYVLSSAAGLTEDLGTWAVTGN